MKSEKVLIFDFDGTIVDSGVKFYELLYKIRSIFSKKNIDISNENNFRDLSSREIIKGLNITIYNLPYIFLRFRFEYPKLLMKTKPVPEIREVLKQLSESGVNMHIVSSSYERNMKSYLKMNHLDFFKFVVGITGFFRKDKAIKRIIEKEKLNPSNVIYIGDETRDVEAARKAGVKSAAVTWGVNSKKALEKENPDWLLLKPEELLNL